MYESFKYVSENLTERETLEQLAEEAFELAQAALKLIRAKKLSNNSTPMTEDDANMNLAEEIDDVIMCVCLYYGGMPFSDVMAMPKWKRWVERLGKHD